MSSIGAAPCAAPISNARAEASRRNGAKSRGPKTPEGKARSAQNALKHGLRAQKCVVLPGERASAFEALEAALLEELAPEGALETVLAQRIVAASWRLARAEQIEAELFARKMHGPFGERGLGLALIRDGNGARAFDTLLRYRGGTLAEFWRALRTLKALQVARAQTAPSPPTEARAPASSLAAVAAPALVAAPREPAAAPVRQPDEPQSRKNPGKSSGPADRVNRSGGELSPAAARLPHRPMPTASEAAPCAQPFEAKRGQPAKAAPPVLPTPPTLPAESIKRGSTAALLRAATALVSPGRRSWP